MESILLPVACVWKTIDGVDTTSCVDICVTFGLSVLTFLVCVALWISYFRSEASGWQHSVLCLACIEGLLCCIYYGVWNEIRLIVAGEVAEKLILLQIAYMLGHVASKVEGKPEIARKYLNPFLTMVFASVIAVPAVYMFTSFACDSFAWMFVSGIGLLLAIICVIASVRITVTLKKAGVSKQYRRKRNCYLWTVVALYCSSVLGEFAYRVAISSFLPTCSGWIHQGPISSIGLVVFIFLKTWNLLVPLWTVMLLFRLLQSASPGGTPKMSRHRPGRQRDTRSDRQPLLQVAGDMDGIEDPEFLYVPPGGVGGVNSEFVTSPQGPVTVIKRMMNQTDWLSGGSGRKPTASPQKSKPRIKSGFTPNRAGGRKELARDGSPEPAGRDFSLPGYH